ncbi:guanine deaminase [Motiliproteus sp. SC1-56]|uniref:guanine deaminase n=1 Tax=Motiliproteus sp. SC1-56 TaxID=2799565 RepID=UPI001A8CF5D7|nr:guanine deaminase [Motiliproteus sp. SC1-56]
MTSALRAFRGPLVDSLGNPDELGLEASCRFIEDGLLLVREGTIEAIGPASALLSQLPPQTPLKHYPDALLCPGFVDTHIHYPQTPIIGSYGEQLLDWLQRFAFPAERALADRTYAAGLAERFLDELLRHGTTTALVFASVHPHSVDALFEAAQKRRLRLLAGKVLMDRHAPDDLLDSPESGYQQSRALIERWHGRDRLGYAITPRFAPTCCDRQLALAGQLLSEFPGVHLQTHISETPAEVAWVRELFPERNGYLDVYDHHGLLGPKTVLAHGVHLTDEERARMADTGTRLAFCPTSNLFLGSGLLDLAATEAAGVTVGLATDVGGGTSFSLLQTLAEAYKVLQLQNQRLHPFKSLYLATLGGAQALGLEQQIGSFAPGKEADFLVLDPAATPLLADRSAAGQSLADRLFALMTLGDDRAVQEVYVLGQRVHQRH